MRRRRNLEIIAGRVNADGSIATGDGFRVQKAGTGTYYIFFPAGFSMVSCVFTKYGADTPWYLGAATESSVNFISVTSIAAGGVDAAFFFIAAGYQK